jgi:hypothetical protein
MAWAARAPGSVEGGGSSSVFSKALAAPGCIASAGRITRTRSPARCVLNEMKSAWARIWSILITTLFFTSAFAGSASPSASSSAASGITSR